MIMHAGQQVCKLLSLERWHSMHSPCHVCMTDGQQELVSAGRCKFEKDVTFFIKKGSKTAQAGSKEGHPIVQDGSKTGSHFWCNHTMVHKAVEA